MYGYAIVSTAQDLASQSRIRGECLESLIMRDGDAWPSAARSAALNSVWLAILHDLIGRIAVWR
jgi:hypothetical protein